MAPEHDAAAVAVAVAGDVAGDEATNASQAEELLRTASHDLRSPLTVIQLLVQRIEWRRRAGKEPSQVEWAESLSRIARAARHALTLVEDMLSPDRLHAHERAGTGPAETVDVHEVITEAIVLQQEALEQAGCVVTVSRRPSLISARGPWDRGCLLRIFSNLLQNASKYAPGAPIRIQLARAGDRLRIVFTDRGPGLPARGETAGKYLDDGEAPTGAHGLGLWIVRRGVGELLGSLKIRNGPGVGLAFAIEIPGLET
jgi:signal transduction histidine kinase